MSLSIETKNIDSQDGYTNAIVLKAMGNQKDERQIALLYNKGDNWFDLNGGGGFETFSSRLFKMINEDPSILCYQGAVYSRGKNGLYKQHAVFEPTFFR